MLKDFLCYSYQSHHSQLVTATALLKTVSLYYKKRLFTLGEVENCTTPFDIVNNILIDACFTH